MKSEKEKMLAGEPYDAHCDEMLAIRTRVKRILHKLNVTEYYYFSKIPLFIDL
jgi:maltose O-acetyltransferase